ncbi:unnamed protein product [Prorocentrum cordatum]|uniref:SET domain-containing protein n=1 Tax=Prorocentrum cordatum TaxID=2364126 RepID=A0ABN9XGM4_9DINO|nr:unnamed protein product [Polarella glacialis]
MLLLLIILLVSRPALWGTAADDALGSSMSVFAEAGAAGRRLVAARDLPAGFTFMRVPESCVLSVDACAAMLARLGAARTQPWGQPGLVSKSPQNRPGRSPCPAQPLATHPNAWGQGRSAHLGQGVETAPYCLVGLLGPAVAGSRGCPCTTPAPCQAVPHGQSMQQLFRLVVPEEVVEEDLRAEGAASQPLPMATRRAALYAALMLGPAAGGGEALAGLLGQLQRREAAATTPFVWPGDATAGQAAWRDVPRPIAEEWRGFLGSLSAEYAELFPALCEAFPASFPVERCTWEAWLRAHSTYTSRAFPRQPGSCSADGVLLPLLDMLNHDSASANVEWRGAGLTERSGARTTRAVAAGEELVYSYGCKGNAELILVMASPYGATRTSSQGWWLTRKSCGGQRGRGSARLRRPSTWPWTRCAGSPTSASEAALGKLSSSCRWTTSPLAREGAALGRLCASCAAPHTCSSTGPRQRTSCRKSCGARARASWARRATARRGAWTTGRPTSRGRTASTASRSARRGAPRRPPAWSRL